MWKLKPIITRHPELNLMQYNTIRDEAGCMKMYYPANTVVSLRLLGFYMYITEGMWWFRWFGYGLHFKNANKRLLIFSERNNIGRNGLVIGKWMFKLLN